MIGIGVAYYATLTAGSRLHPLAFNGSGGACLLRWVHR